VARFNIIVDNSVGAYFLDHSVDVRKGGGAQVCVPMSDSSTVKPRSQMQRFTRWCCPSVCSSVAWNGYTKRGFLKN